MLNLIVNITLKYKSTKDYKRKDAMQAAKLGAVVAHQWLDKKKPHFKQFETILSEANAFVTK